jgi:hypothetical protein
VKNVFRGFPQSNLETGRILGVLGKYRRNNDEQENARESNGVRIA